MSRRGERNPVQVQTTYITPEIKAQIVLEVISGTKTFSEAFHQYQLSEQTLSTLKEEFLQKAAVVFEHQSQSEQEQAHLVELERMVGKLTLELEIAKKPPRSCARH